MTVLTRMHHTRVTVHGTESRPKLLFFGRQGVEGSSLVCEVRPTSFFGNANDLISDVTECARLEAAIVVPLGPLQK